MFTKSVRSRDDIVLKNLADIYKGYSASQWNYYSQLMELGGFLIDGCIADSQKLKSMSIIIGKGLLEGKEDAKTATLLFEKLYKDGFKDGLFKDNIQNRFKEILSQESVAKLNEGATTMADCMKSIYLYEQTMAFKPL